MRRAFMFKHSFSRAKFFLKSWSISALACSYFTLVLLTWLNFLSRLAWLISLESSSSL